MRLVDLILKIGDISGGAVSISAGRARSIGVAVVNLWWLLKSPLQKWVTLFVPVGRVLSLLLIIALLDRGHLVIILNRRSGTGADTCVCTVRGALSSTRRINAGIDGRIQLSGLEESSDHCSGLLLLLLCCCCCRAYIFTAVNSLTTDCNISGCGDQSGGRVRRGWGGESVHQHAAVNPQVLCRQLLDLNGSDRFCARHRSNRASSRSAVLEAARRVSV